MMVLNRIINNDFMQKGITYSFVPIYGKFLNSAYKKNILEDCKLNIAKTLFDKNNAENFWKLFADIYTAVTLPDYLSIDEAYKKLDTNTLSSLIFLDIISVKYLMALIKDGIHDN
jgi:ribonucleotide reductase beta subunit family protein with ferritin-like domain